jgi:hypothetical protein
LYGGLGNQLFQYSAALLLSKKFKISIKLFDYTSSYKYKFERDFELTNFIDLGEDKVFFNSSFFLSLRLPRLLNSKHFISDKNFSSLIRADNFSSRVWLDGYFQDCVEQVFFEQVVELLKIKLLPKFKGLIITESPVIHIRGGDFVTLGWDRALPETYYQSAVSFFVKELGCNNFNIVTDDVYYAKLILSNLGVNLNFVDADMYDHFRLIMMSKYRILSNSTFAFWASALGHNDDSIVIAPEFWSPGRKRNLRLPGEISI